MTSTFFHTIQESSKVHDVYFLGRKSIKLENEGEKPIKKITITISVG